MRSDKTRPVGIALMAVAFVASLVLLAGPAGANPGSAKNGSVSSGDSDANNASVSSGCANAQSGSTASGGPPCGEQVLVEEVLIVEELVPAPAPVATANGAKNLAMTGSSTVPLAAGAAGLVLVGGLMMVATTDRRRALSHS